MSAAELCHKRPKIIFTKLSVLKMPHHDKTVWQVLVRESLAVEAYLWYVGVTF